MPRRQGQAIRQRLTTDLWLRLWLTAPSRPSVLGPGTASLRAERAVANVNAAKRAVAWDDVDVDNGGHYARCTVYVLDWLDDPYVRLWCTGDRGQGTAWVRVSVPGVRGNVTRVSASLTGDCNTNEISWRKRGSTVLVKISVSADANCEVRTVRVRYA